MNWNRHLRRTHEEKEVRMKHRSVEVFAFAVSDFATLAQAQRA